MRKISKKCVRKKKKSLKFSMISVRKKSECLKFQRNRCEKKDVVKISQTCLRKLRGHQDFTIMVGNTPACLELPIRNRENQRRA
jgi:hypothetical protein